jgi:hypothetical protein
VSRQNFQAGKGERKRDYIHPALRADETTMLSKPQKYHFDNRTKTEGEGTTDKHAGSVVKPNNPIKGPHENETLRGKAYAKSVHAQLRSNLKTLINEINHSDNVLLPYKFP